MIIQEKQHPYNELDGNRAYIAQDDFYSDREEYFKELQEIYNSCKEIDLDDLKDHWIEWTRW
jgi:hypothetical protein